MIVVWSPLWSLTTYASLYVGHLTLKLLFQECLRCWTVKLSLCLTNRSLRHEDIWGSACIDPSFPVLGISWRWVISFTTRPLYPWGKSPGTQPTLYECTLHKHSMFFEEVSHIQSVCVRARARFISFLQFALPFTRRICSICIKRSP
jgi:hypothetical protein